MFGHVTNRLKWLLEKIESKNLIFAVISITSNTKSNESLSITMQNEKTID